MTKSRLISGRVPVTPPDQVSADRHQFLSLSEAEPSLGTAPVNTVLTFGDGNTRVWTDTLSIGNIAVSGNLTVAGSDLNQVVGSIEATLAEFETYANLTYAPLNDPTFIHDVTIQGNVYAGNVFLAGNTTLIATENLTIADNIVNLHSPGDNSALSVDDGKDIGFAFHYYKDGDNHAGLVWANDTGYLEYYSAGSDEGNVFVGTEYGTIKSGGYIGNTITANTITTSTITTGNLISTANIVGVDCYISNLYLDGDLAVDYFTGIGDFINNSNAYVIGYTTTTSSSTANFVGYIDHRTLWITSMISGTITLGMVISGPGVTAGTYIKKFKAGSVGGVGDYELSVDKSVGSKTSLVTFSGIGPGGAYQAGGFLFVDYTITANGLVVKGNTTTTGTTTIAGNTTVNNLTSNGKVTSTNMLVTGQLNVNNKIYGKEIFDNDNRVITSITPNAGTGITLSGVNSSAPDVAFTVNNAGVTAIAGTANETTVDRSTGSVTVGLPASVTIQTKLTAGNIQTTSGVFWANGVNYTSSLNSSINTINANLGAYQTYANSSITTNANSIQSINANLGAYQTYANSVTAYGNTQVAAYLTPYYTFANANAATQATSINNLNANLGAYQTFANANASIQATSINTINANLGAYQTYANATFTYGNAQVAAYLPTHTGNVGAAYLNTTNGIYWANGTAYTSNITNYISVPVTSNVNVGSLDTSIAAGGSGNTTVSYSGANSVRFWQHTAAPAGAWTMNFTNLALNNNQATSVKVMLPPSSVGDYLATPSQIDGTTVGVTNTIGTLKASKNKTNIFKLEIIKGSGGAYTIYGDVTSY